MGVLCIYSGNQSINGIFNFIRHEENRKKVIMNIPNVYTNINNHACALVLKGKLFDFDCFRSFFGKVKVFMCVTKKKLE